MIREFSAGGVVFKKLKIKNEKLKVYWLVAKSAPSKLYPKSVSRLPKGWLDDEDGGKKPGHLALGKKKATSKEMEGAALREVREEGGVEAKIVKKLSTERYFFTFEKEKILKFVTFYLMEWVKDLPEGPGFETEKVEWLPYEEARKRLTHSGEKKILDKAYSLLNAGMQGNLL